MPKRKSKAYSNGFVSSDHNDVVVRSSSTSQVPGEKKVQEPENKDAEWITDWKHQKHRIRH